MKSRCGSRTRDKQKTLPVAIGAAMLGFPYGYAHGTEMPLEASAAGYVAAFNIAAAGLATLGVGVAMAILRLPRPLGW